MRFLSKPSHRSIRIGELAEGMFAAFPRLWAATARRVPPRSVLSSDFSELPPVLRAGGGAPLGSKAVLEELFVDFPRRQIGAHRTRNAEGRDVDVLDADVRTNAGDGFAGESVFARHSVLSRVNQSADLGMQQVIQEAVDLRPS